MQKLLQDFSVPAVFAGFITFLIGISVSAVLVIQAAQLLGANPEQITSWFWALGLGIGLSGLILSWKFKYPVATSWSTAALALIIATASGYSLYEAIGAFLVSGLLTAVLGFSGIFEKIINYIPQSLTSAMLAGVLLKFGIALFASMQNDWAFILSLLAVYVITKRLWARYCIVITVIAGIIICPFFMEFHVPTLHWGLAKPVWMMPEFTWSAILGLALPLFVINMASQYLPGIAMIKSYGYQPHVNQLIGWTGTAQTLLSPFGCYTVNIAAISAAVSLDDQVHPDPSKRYIAGMSCGFFYILMGLFAATLTSLLMSFPHLFIVALAGIALFGTISHNIAIAFHEVKDREAALLTFLFSASGIQFFGIGSAFWGLLFGFAVSFILNFRIRK
ncbi:MULTISPECIES: benzoate/H(+) symporter BenE family transporter [Acinetobacter]|uniref:Benzoate/H(+) symporter BenE family transporter n=2 Tax=Gammaproteobacteria TaxID=1236 RepID=A0A0A8TFA4_ACIBZ|nr:MULTISPECIES: benzoate/H(+) symporter BenE family transporter [Acinetobacter]MEC8123047.1 benzoate/H(+) symporter BenE family transporter [Pseudomonadota bacterium]ELW86874.1 benzoate transporter [Acinetobacter sp. WC-743]MBI0393830.1 benzoate/H(+) symporter BenE family transporter [Acinetobacter bereziniae]MBJ8424478.1 benzoate/H(+) symporter BenE family transporter [Acinetobacter bereziniae]MBJ8452445.1 benzoate/H(+) symporter BenE family transporter [Acinetobacter bereziniae]